LGKIEMEKHSLAKAELKGLYERRRKLHFRKANVER